MIRFFIESAVCYLLYSVALRFLGAERVHDFLDFCIFTAFLFILMRVGQKLEQVLRLKKEGEA